MFDNFFFFPMDHGKILDNLSDLVTKSFESSSDSL